MLNSDDRALVLGGFAVAAGIVWLYAGVVKIRWSITKADLAALAPPLARLHPVLRWAVPGVEITIGLALVSGMHTRAAGIAGTLLAATFAVLHVAAMLRAGLTDAPLPRGCGCFGRANLDTVPSPPTAPNPPVASNLDVAEIRSRGWQWTKAALLTIVTWTATLPCGLCGDRHPL